jgi:hypothetical protein
MDCLNGVAKGLKFDAECLKYILWDIEESADRIGPIGMAIVGAFLRLHHLSHTVSLEALYEPSLKR